MGFHGGFVENVGRGGGGNKIIPLLQLGMQAQRFQAQQDQIKKQEALQAQEQARLNTEIDIFSSPGFLSLSEANKGKTIRDLQTQGLLKENGRITNGGLQQYTQSVLAKTELFSVFAENEVAEQRQRVIKSFQDLRKAREIDPTNAPKLEKLQKAFEFLQAEQESLVQGTTAQLKVLAENDQKEAGNIRLNEMIKKALDPGNDMSEADKIAVSDTAKQSGRPGAAQAIIKRIQDVKQFQAFESSLGEESSDPLIQGFKAAGDFGSVAKRFEKLEGGGERSSIIQDKNVNTIEFSIALSDLKEKQRSGSITKEEKRNLKVLEEAQGIFAGTIPGQKTTARTRAKEAATPLPAVAQKGIDQLNTLKRITGRIKKSFKPNFVGKLDSPAGAIREFTGKISKEEVIFRKDVQELSEIVLRMRSGAQINESEFKRIRKVLAKTSDQDNVFQAALDRTVEEIDSIIQSKVDLATRPKGFNEGESILERLRSDPSRVTDEELLEALSR